MKNKFFTTLIITNVFLLLISFSSPSLTFASSNNELTSIKTAESELLAGVIRSAYKSTKSFVRKIFGFSSSGTTDQNTTQSDNSSYVGSGGSAGNFTDLKDEGCGRYVRGGFVWKPISESDRKLVVLIPSNYTKHTIRGSNRITHNGRTIETGNSRPFDGGNGNREHYRFDRPGFEYPRNIYFEIDLIKGGTAKWKIPNNYTLNGDRGCRHAADLGQPIPPPPPPDFSFIDIDLSDVLDLDSALQNIPKLSDERISENFDFINETIFVDEMFLICSGQYPTEDEIEFWLRELFKTRDANSVAERICNLSQSLSYRRTPTSMLNTEEGFSAEEERIIEKMMSDIMREHQQQQKFTDADLQKVAEIMEILKILGIIPGGPVTQTIPATTQTPTIIPATTQIIQPQAPASSTSGYNRDLTIGSRGSDVMRLQQFLNRNGFIVSITGSGSPGNETDYFGPSTRSALARFQAANNISPAIGYFGPLTRNIVSDNVVILN